MNWEKYKQKYFFEGVKNYNEIDKALLFTTDYTEIAELFKKITTDIIISEDYSDENINKICYDVFNSINKEPLLKSKFINAWTSFNQTLGIDETNLKKSVSDPNDEISNLLRHYDENTQPTVLTVDEYGLAGQYIARSLVKLDFPFEMAAEISRILLEDYPIELPKNQTQISSKNETKKWSKLYKSMLDNKKYSQPAKTKAIQFVDHAHKAQLRPRGTKRHKPFVSSIPIKKYHIVNTNTEHNSVNPNKISTPTSILITSSLAPRRITAREGAKESTVRITAKANTEDYGLIETTSNRSLANSLFLNNLPLNQERQENNNNNNIAGRSVSEQRLALRSKTLSILLASNEISHEQYKDELNRLQYYDEIPKQSVIHCEFKQTIPDQKKSLSQFGSFVSNSLPLSHSSSRNISSNTADSSIKPLSPTSTISNFKADNFAQTSESETSIVTSKWCSKCLPIHHGVDKKK